MVNDWLMKGNKGLVPMPQYGTTLKGHPSSRAPCSISWGPVATEVQVSFFFFLLFLGYFFIIALIVGFFFNIFIGV